jgi:hypothetical protein
MNNSFIFQQQYPVLIAMIEKLPGSAGNILGFRLWGKLTESDYRDLLMPELEKAMKEYPKIRVLFTLEQFEGWTVGGAWEDFTLLFKLPGIERMALVVDETWDEWMTWLFKAFTAFSRTELRFFRKDRNQEAWDWVRA